MMDAISDGMPMGPALQATLAGDVEPIDGYFIYSVVVSLGAYVVAGLLEGPLRGGKPQKI